MKDSELLMGRTWIQLIEADPESGTWVPAYEHDGRWFTVQLGVEVDESLIRIREPKHLRWIARTVDGVRQIEVEVSAGGF